MLAQRDKEFSAHLPELFPNDTVQPILLHEGTEREIPRPVDYDEQKEQYSGKKKRHTIKNAVHITTSCLILFVSQIVSGKTHDKKKRYFPKNKKSSIRKLLAFGYV